MTFPAHAFFAANPDAGNIDGFHANCIVEPELEFGQVVLFNHEDAQTNLAHGSMVNEILRGLEPGALLLP